MHLVQEGQRDSARRIRARATRESELLREKRDYNPANRRRCSTVARAETLTGGTHSTFMRDFLFFTAALPAEQRVPVVGDVDPATAFGQISVWVGDFVATHVQHRKSE
jgi:hypothetical protein